MAPIGRPSQNPSHVDYIADTITGLDEILARVDAGEEVASDLREVRDGVSAAAMFALGSRVFQLPPRVMKLKELGGFDEYVRHARQAA